MAAGLTSRLSAVAAWWKQSRFRCLFVMALLCLSLRENYPFSNFPMYSSFGSRTNFLYLADAKGTALATKQFGLTSSTLKKIFDHHRRMELIKTACSVGDCVRVAENAAGQSLLRDLDHLQTRRVQPPTLRGLQVRQVNVQLEAGDLRFTTRTLVTHP